MTEPDGGPLCIVAAGGALPAGVARAVAESGRPVFVLALRGLADADAVAAFPHEVVPIGALSAIERAMRRQGCRDLVMVGDLKRPPWRSVRFDWGALRFLPIVLGYARTADNALLRQITAAFERTGFRVRSLREVMPQFVAPTGRIAGRELDPAERTDVAQGFALLRATGAYDLGQAAVVYRGRVLGIEAAEGTDALIRRMAALRAEGRFAAPLRSGVLVKAPKPAQELRDDMPVIGKATVEAAASAGLAGIAVAAGGVFLADMADTVAAAEAAGLFLHGSSWPDA